MDNSKNNRSRSKQDYSGRNDKMYYYTINGQTGKVCGKLPVDYGKLGITSAVISAAVFALGLLGGLLI